MQYFKRIWLGLAWLSGLAMHPAILSAEDKSATREGLVKLPSAGGTVQKDETSFNFASSHGGVSYSVPLPSLPARGGLAPNLAMTYSQNSGDGGTGLGIGWSINSSAIYVNDDLGTAIRQRYEENQDFFSHLSLDGQRLISLYVDDATADPIYALESSPSAVRITYTKKPRQIQILGARGETRTVAFPGGFIVSYPDGKKVYYAEQEASAEWDVNSPNHATRWPITLAVSPTGEAIEYFYTKQKVADKNGVVRLGGRSYLKEIRFAGGASRYVFETIETRGSLVNYRSAYRLTNDKLYGGVKAYFRDELQGQICMAYMGRKVDSDDFTIRAGDFCREEASKDLADALQDRRSLNVLDQMRVIYQGGATAQWNAETSAPKIRLTYSNWKENDQERSIVFPVPAMANANPRAQQFELFDYDLDALVDIVSSQNGTTRVRMGDDSLEKSFETEQQWTVERDGQVINPSLDSAAFHFAEINGDSLVDLVELRNGQMHVYFRKSNGQFESGQTVNLGWINPSHFQQLTHRWLDLNGDGLTDVLSSSSINGKTYWTVYVNRTLPEDNGYAIDFKATQLSLPAAYSSSFITDENTLFTDVNGDQLIDFVRILPQKNGFCLYENQGDIYGSIDTMPFKYDNPTLLDRTQCEQGKFVQVAGLDADSQLSGHRIWMMDANGDGILDLVTLAKNDTELKVWLGFGNGDFLAKPLSFSLLDEQGRPQIAIGAAGRTMTRLADIDGDGQTELVIFQPGTASIKPTMVIDFNRLGETQLIKSNLLTTVVSDTGLRYDLRYVSSIDEMLRDRARGLPQGFLHFPVYLVKQLMTSELDPETKTFKPGREVIEMQYHEPFFDPKSKKFVGFSWVETVSYGDEYLGPRMTQKSHYKREVFARNYLLSGKLLESYMHEFVPQGTFAEQNQASTEVAMDDIRLHSMKDYAQSQASAVAGRLIFSKTEKWDLVEAGEGYNGEKAWFQRLLETRDSHHASNGQLKSESTKTYSEFDAYNIPGSVLESDSAIASPYGVTIPARTIERRYSYETSRQQLSALEIVDFPSEERILDRSSGGEKDAKLTTYTYNDKGQLVQTIRKAIVELESTVPGWKNSPDRREGKQFDLYGNVISESMNEVQMEAVVYDAEGILPLQTKNAIGQTVELRYGLDALPGCPEPGDRYVPKTAVGTQKDILGTCHYYSYDANGRKTRYARNDGYVEEYSYQWAHQGLPSRILKKATRYGPSDVVPEGEAREILSMEAHSMRGQKLATFEVDETGKGTRVIEFKEFNRRGKTILDWTPYQDPNTDIVSIFNSGRIPVASATAVIAYTYDSMGRMVSARYPTGRSEFMSYEPWGQKVRATFADGAAPTERAVIKHGDRVHATVDALGHVARYTYDIYDNIISILLPNETNPRLYSYDALGRKLKQCAPDIGCTWFTYNDLGYPERRLVYDKDGKLQHTVEYLYDVLGRLTEVKSDGVLIQRDTYDRYPQGMAPASGLPRPNGLLAVSEVFDPHKLYNVRKVMSYDSNSRVIERTLTYEGAQLRNFVEKYDYTLDGATRSIIDPFKVKAVYRLAPSMRFMGLDVYLPWAPTKKETVIESIDYNAQGKILSIQYREGARNHLDYDPETLILRAQQATYRDPQAGEVFLQNSTITFDGNGSVTSIDDAVPVQTPYGAVNRSGTFTYNARDELVSFERYGESHSFKYDANGNFIENTELGPITLNNSGRTKLLPRGSSQVSYTFNSLGQLKSRMVAAGTQVQDDDKQRTTNILDMKYDSLGRLVYTRTSKGELFYGYDVDGYRLYKRFVPAGSTQVKDSLYPSKVNIVEPTGDQSFVMVGSQRIVRIDHSQQSLNKGTWYYYLFDHLGSTEYMMHADGKPVEQMVYRAYGTEPSLKTLGEGRRFLNYLEQNQSILPKERTHHRYTGQYLDDDSGLYYYGARYYDPLLGRFISPDPLYYNTPEKCIGNALACNLYVYAANNPMSKIDPLGLDDEPWYRQALGTAKEVVRGVSAGVIDSVPIFGSRYIDATAGEQSRTFQVTRALTNIAVGTVEAGLGYVVGTGGGAAGGAACATGVGCVVGAPVAVGAVVTGAAMATHGTYQIGTGLERLYKVATGSGGGGGGPEYPRDYQTKNTVQKSSTFKSEGEARDFAKKALGEKPVNIGDNKLRSQDGKWQYRAKAGDVKDNHVHLEKLDPKTGEVLENWHLNFPESGKR